MGTAALQLATALGARVIGTARTPAKLDRCRELGLVHGIVPPTSDGALDVDALAWSIVEATDGGVDVTIDLAGGRYAEADIAAAALRGRIVLVGSIAGTRASLPIHITMAKRLSIYGTVLRARNADEKGAATAAFVRDVVPMLADGAHRAGGRRRAPAGSRRRGLRPRRVGRDVRQGHPRLPLTPARITRM